MNDLVDVLVRYGYLVVFGWVFAEQIGLPLPAMPVLLAAGARRSIACCLVEAPAPRQADSRSRPFSPLHLALAEQWRQDQWTVVDQTPAEPPSILRRSRSQCV